MKHFFAEEAKSRRSRASIGKSSTLSKTGLKEILYYSVTPFFQSSSVNHILIHSLIHYLFFVVHDALSDQKSSEGKKINVSLLFHLLRM